MFSTLENISHRYFEHKIEKNWTFHQVFKFPCFLLLKWAPKPSDRVAGSLKWHVLTLGVLSKNWGIRWFPKFFADTLGHVLQHTRAPKELERPPSLQSTWSLTEYLIFGCCYMQKRISVPNQWILLVKTAKMRYFVRLHVTWRDGGFSNCFGALVCCNTWPKVSAKKFWEPSDTSIFWQHP